MKIQKIGERNLVVAFLEPFYTTTHLIFGDNRVYVCDTFLGPEPMKEIAKIIKENGHEDKPIVVFNSHADWDHIWGNCYFKDSIILGHRLCKERIEKEGKDELNKHFEEQRGNVIMTPPTTIFDSTYFFEDDSIEFFHSPGHTIDSSSCYDHIDRILFVGDNIESDLPYVNSLDFDTYISTLKGYHDLDWTHLVPGHDPVQTDDTLVQSNLEYLRNLKEWEINLNDLSQKGLDVHLYTLSKLVDELLRVGFGTNVNNHYHDALRILEKREQSEMVRHYKGLYRRILDRPCNP